ncbi:M48 family metalloprotease [Mycobacterium avium]|uniref:M48 family metalloprotease n=1 Tax=Mycobacterium avium TaxID=1764 RepID=UPI0015938682|nr:M48 family metalloprotease [Mycobacterium avium]
MKTAALLGLLTGMILVAGQWLGGFIGLIIAAVDSVAFNAFVYFKSDAIALRAMRARPLSRAEAPQLYAMVADLADQADQPMPRLYLSPIRQPNAFATGRSPRHAAVCVTAGIVDQLSLRELRAVLGHELAHVYNRDILTSTVAAALAGILTMLADLAWFMPLTGSVDDEDSGSGVLGALLMLIVAPLAAVMIQLAISRNREYAADADGAALSGDPQALASALRKIHAGTQQLPLPADGHLASAAHLMIADPLRGEGLAALFSTHPPMGQRIARLERLAHRMTGTAPAYR